ncbi:MAG: hypothetical protein DMF84_18315 [Acidobacteria bacterium]|nr:MAG: hypothetical protein DMF84_18315 [Acidobacteriota bacterium]
MDRSDERKDNPAGDVLGLGGSVGGSDTIEPPARTVDEDQQRRRKRMSEGADEVTPGGIEKSGGVHHGAGATGIDMGAGGEGTDIE